MLMFLRGLAEMRIGTWPLSVGRSRRDPDLMDLRIYSHLASYQRHHYHPIASAALSVQRLLDIRDSFPLGAGCGEPGQHIVAVVHPGPPLCRAAYPRARLTTQRPSRGGPRACEASPRWVCRGYGLCSSQPQGPSGWRTSKAKDSQSTRPSGSTTSVWP